MLGSSLPHRSWQETDTASLFCLHRSGIAEESPDPEGAAVNRLLAISILGLALAVPGAGQSAPPPDPATELRRVTQELLDAIAPGNAAPWKRVLDERFTHLDENGVVRDRAAFLAELQPLPAGLVGRIEIDKWA